MATIAAYIDGFNLYYGSLKRSKAKWLNPRALLEGMFSSHQLSDIKYFTAKVKPRRTDPDQPIRQEIYWRALRTVPGLEIIKGNFLEKPKCFALAKPGRYIIRGIFLHLLCPDILRSKEGVLLARVMKSEEKGSDVNLAAHLINDAHFRRFDEAIVVSGDSDLTDAVRIVVREIGKPVTIVNPQQNSSRELRSVATAYRHIHPGEIAKSQFPNPMRDRTGEFSKPRSW